MVEYRPIGRRKFAIFLWILSAISAATAAGNSTTSGRCSKSEFGCAVGGQCVDLLKWQDGIEDCWDGSDEVCLPWQFDCKFGNPRCISTKKAGDGRIDCYSGIDEGCPSHFFVCADRSACIEPIKYQDGVRDCGDGSDEPCRSGEFPCNDGSACIDGTRFQDGKEDCKDGSDEECTASQFECACGRTRCIDAGKLGDGKKDCEDGSDEVQSPSGMAKKKERKCPDGKEKRTSRNSLLYGEVQLCGNAHGCLEDLGQICIVVGGTWRCVCKLGTVRPLGAARCLPTELLSAYISNPVANCSDLERDLHLQFSSPAKTKKKEATRRSPQKFLVSDDNTTTSMMETLVEQKKRGKILVGTTPDMSKNEVYEALNTTDPFNGIVRVTTNGSDVASSIDGGAREEKERRKGDCDPTIKDSCKGAHQHCMSSSTEKGRFVCGCERGWEMAEEQCYQQINECSSPFSNDCDAAALCMDSVKGYECLCREGYLDVSPHPLAKPGRKCLKLTNECASAASNDCSPNARCIDRPAGYTCRCMEEFVDLSPEGGKRPGRVCEKRGINECAAQSHDCDSAAVCVDTPEGFTCHCPTGFADVSPDPGKKPGRICAQHLIDPFVPFRTTSFPGH